MQEIKKTAKAGILAFLIFITVFSLFFESMEADHVCSGDDCPVCAVIQIVQLSIKLLALAVLFAATFGMFSGNKKNTPVYIEKIFRVNSLISQKVEMNS